MSGYSFFDIKIAKFFSVLNIAIIDWSIYVRDRTELKKASDCHHTRLLYKVKLFFFFYFIFQLIHSILFKFPMMDILRVFFFFISIPLSLSILKRILLYKLFQIRVNDDSRFWSALHGIRKSLKNKKLKI